MQKAQSLAQCSKGAVEAAFVYLLAKEETAHFFSRDVWTRTCHCLSHLCNFSIDYITVMEEKNDWDCIEKQCLNQQDRTLHPQKQKCSGRDTGAFSKKPAATKTKRESHKIFVSILSSELSRELLLSYRIIISFRFQHLSIPFSKTKRSVLSEIIVE